MTKNITSGKKKFFEKLRNLSKTKKSEQIFLKDETKRVFFSFDQIKYHKNY